MKNGLIIESEKLTTSRHLGDLLLVDLPVGLVVLDSDASLIDVNDCMFRYFNMQKEDVSGKRFGNLFNCKNAVTSNKICGTGDLCKDCFINIGLEQVLNGGAELKEVEFSHDFILNGRQNEKWFTINASRIIKGDKTTAIVTFTDITKIKKTEKELIKLGITDELSGLYNRRFIIERGKKVLYENAFPISLAILDIDHFKNINDTYGHAEGDVVIVGLADLFRKLTRDTDYIGRYGGDEFLIIFSNTNIKAAQMVLSRIADKFKDIINDKTEAPISFSVGLVEIQAEDVKKNDLSVFIKKADDRMYKAKSEGRNMIEIGSQKNT